MNLNALLTSETQRRNFMIACKLFLELDQFDWYDSVLRNRIRFASRFLAIVRPDQVGRFVAEMDRLRTDPGFTARKFPRFLEQDRFEQLRRDAAPYLKAPDREDKVAEPFGLGKFINMAPFNDLLFGLTDWVGQQVGEPVSPRFTQLTTYQGKLDLPLHLDSPDSKWVLGICLDHNFDWPIAVSKVVDWPDSASRGHGFDAAIKADPSLEFREFLLEPNEAVLFSASGQWHYRNRIAANPSGYYHMLHLQYVPEGCNVLVEPGRWAQHFGIEELETLDTYFRWSRDFEDSKQPTAAIAD